MSNPKLDDAISKYLSGESVEDAAEASGIDSGVLRRVLKERGLQRSAAEIEAIKRRKARERFRERHAAIWDKVVGLYVSGESEKAVAEAFGVERGTVRRILEDSGTHVRSASEAERLKWQRMTPEQKAWQTRHAHVGGRGKTLSWETKCAQALGKQLKCPNQSPTERQLWQWLYDLGLEAIPQQAIGAYNADLGAFPIAVEVYGGNFHAYGRHAARFTQRCRYFADQGWALVVIWCYGGNGALSVEAAKYVIAFLDEVKRDPTLIGKYRMIGGGGQLFAAGSLYANNLTSVLTRCASLNARSGNQNIAG